MIFDDDKDIVSICTFIFKKLNWNVSAFETCADIVAKVKEEMPDVILMDNWIPEMGGVAATQLIKGQADLNNIPVIYFSANADVKKLAAQAGADSYIGKPFDIKEFEHLIAQYGKVLV